MEINYLIAHEINKKRNETGAELRLSRTTLPENELANDLVGRLDALFTQAQQISYSAFDEYGIQQFPQHFRSYRDNSSEEEFIRLSQTAAGDLHEELQQIPAASGGYLVFVDYAAHSSNFFAVFFLRMSGGILFHHNRETERLELRGTSYLDPDRMAMAGRIDKVKFGAGTGNYLWLIRNPRLRDVADYFVEWLAADTESMASNKSCTEAITMLIDDMPCPVDPETGELLERDEFKERALTYARNRPDKVLNVAAMGREFYDDEQYIQNFADEQGLDLIEEFKPDIRTLKRTTQVDAFADGIKLSFPPGLINQLVKVEGRSPGRIVIESPALVDLIRRQLSILNREGLE